MDNRRAHRIVHTMLVSALIVSALICSACGGNSITTNSEIKATHSNLAVNYPQQTATAIGRNTDGRLEFFAPGTDGAVWHMWQLTPGGRWSGWASLGAPFGTSVLFQPPQEPKVVRTSSGALEVFITANDKSVYTSTQTSDGGWIGWTPLGGQTLGPPEVAQNVDGRLVVFITGLDNVVYQKEELTTAGSWPLVWSSLGGQTECAPTVGENADGRLEAFTLAPNGLVFHAWQETPGGTWSPWAVLGGQSINANIPLTVGENGDGRLEVFGIDVNGVVYHNWQLAPGGAWSGWSSLGGSVSFMTVIRDGNGNLDIFAQDTTHDGQAYQMKHIWQTGNGWSGWSSLGGQVILQPYVGENTDGQLDVFAQRIYYAGWVHIPETTSGTWPVWYLLGTP